MIESWRKARIQARKKAGTSIKDLRVLKRIDESWRCPVCGGRELVILDSRQNAVNCKTCGFPFSLPNAFGKGKIVPLPAYNDRILEERKRAWLDKGGSM